MSDTTGNGKFRKPPSRKGKASPGRHVTLSAEARAQYEKLVKERDERDRDYARHLGQDNKPK